MGGDIPGRGRPRSAEADRAILTATAELLAERGLADMSIEEVAARAGVGKATIYRRWSSKGLLALDAFVASFREQQPLPDTGTLRGDLLATLRAWVRAVTRTPAGPMLTGLIAEAQHDKELHAAWRDRVLEPLRVQRRVMLDRAIARGEIPSPVDREVVLDMLFGAAEHRLLLGHLPLTDAFIREMVDMILDGIRGRLAGSELRGAVPSASFVAFVVFVRGVFAVDPGLAVVPVHYGAPDQPRSPKPPQ
jgi:AcrR family transcriptional regulator